MKLYVRNEGTQPVTLSKALANWNPTSLSSYLTINWDYNNQTLTPSSTVAVTLSLTVSATTQATANFSFDTIITASN
jgi:hypothetical protein